MESGTTGDPDPVPQSDGVPGGIRSEEDSRGYNELKLVGEISEGAEHEMEEVDLSPEFDFYEDLAGDKLRLLDSFTIYDADGRPVPPLALDGAKERGQRFVVFGTVVAPLTPDARAKLFSLDVRLKGRIPPCLPKSLQGGAPEPLPWVASLLPTPPAPKGGGGSKAGKSSTTKKPRSRPKTSGKQASKNDGGSGLEPGHTGSMETEAGRTAGHAAGGQSVVAMGVDDEGVYGGSYSPGSKRPLAHKDGPISSTPASKKARKGGNKLTTSDKTPETSGGTGASATSGSDRKDDLLLPAHQLLAGVGASDVSRENGNPSDLVPHKGFPPLAPATPSRPAEDPGAMMPQAKGGGGADGGGNASLSGPKKRKGGDSGAAAMSAGKKTKLPPSFSLAAFVGGLDGSETRGVTGAEFVGSSFRRGRKDGLLLYYVDKAPRDYPFEYESKAAGAASLDWSYMRKHLKVDAFCMETFRWYGAKVAEVSIERQQVKVHFNGWKSKFDEWMDWGSFRLAPCGSRSSAKREGEQASGPVKKESSTRCVLVPARRTARLRIEGVDDWCIDHSDPAHPVLWFISPNAWYKVAGAAWWDFVAPHPLYARIFEPARRGFAAACLVARCLQSSPLASFATVARRVSQFSSGVFEAPEIIEHHEIVTATVVGMGTLSIKKARDNTGGEGGGGSGDDTPYGGTWLVSNGDKDQQPVSIEAKDTLFLKELRAKVQERMARARRPASRPGARNASPRRAQPSEGHVPNASDRDNPGGMVGPIEEDWESGSLSPVPRRGEGGSGGKASGGGSSRSSSGRGSAGGRGGSGGAGGVLSAQAEAAAAAAAAAKAAANAKAKAEKERKEEEKRKKEEEREREKDRRETERLRKEQEKDRREREREKERAEKAMEKEERAMEKAMAKKVAMEKALAKKAAMEKKAQEKAEEAAAKRAALEKKAQERVERQRQIVEEKERIRKAKEAERLAKLEAKRLEKEAKDRERAETQAREQARREADREKARLAKRYPIPDEELWEEQRQLGRYPVPWPEAGKVPCPKGFPASAVGDVVNIWSCLQLFGPLMHLRRFSLAELMAALAHDAPASDSRDFSEDGDGASPDEESDEDDAESLMDVIPAPFHPSSMGEDINGSSTAAELIANIHMRLLDFLAWDRTRALRCAPEGKHGAYWRSLFPQVSWATSGVGGTASGASGPSGAAGGSNGGQQADSGGGTLGGGLSASGSWPTAFQSGDEEDFKGAPETTLPGLRDSRELLQASPHGWPELLRLVAMGREGILGGADSCGALLSASRANAAEDGNSMLKGLQRRALLRSRHLDPLGEVLRILRHVARLEEARGFLAPPPDSEVYPGSRDAEGGEGSVVSKDEVGCGSGSGSGSEAGGGASDEGEEKDPTRLLRRPLDIGSIAKRIERGWYDPEATAEPPFPSKSFGAGHAGVAYDMKLMQQGWLEARGVDSIVHEQARTVVEEFLSLYETHVTHVLEPLREVNKALGVPPRTAETRSDCVRAGANVFLDREAMDDEAAEEAGEGDEEDMGDPLVMLQQMGSEEYVNWCPAARSRALAWLCDEAFSASTINDLVKKILEAKEVVDRKDREVKAAVRQKIREDEAREASGSHPGSASVRRGTEADMISARIGSEGAEMKTARQLGSVKVRLKPLGTDRNRRRYWLLAKGEDHRLFTELVGKWGCYARVSQIKTLHKWLDRRGIRERTLKAGVREHLITNLGVSAEELDPPDRPSGYRGRRDDEDTDGEDDEEPQYIGEPAEVAREKERERNAGREALRLCGFEAEDQRYVLERLCQPFAVDMSTLRHARLAFEPRTRGFVLRDVAVRLGPNGLDGVEFDVSNGGVIVAGYASTLDGARNFGQDAGVQVGEVVVSIHNSVAEDPKSLLMDLEGVAAVGETAKMVVMKVLTLVQLTDANGEPAAGALDYRTIDRLKGALLEAETRLHHHYVIGPGWEGRACRGWRLGVAFAGQGLGKSWGHEALVPPSVWSRAGGDRNPAEADDADDKAAELLPFGDEGPNLREEGTVELGPLTPEGGRLAVAELGRRVLQLEASVSKQDTVVDARWGQLGRRRKWRTFVGKVETAAQLLAAWSAFDEVIDWQAARWCYSDLDRRSFLSLLPAHARNTIPEIGDTVIYFGDGHVISVESERKSGHDTAWGSDTPIPCAVIPSTVKSICYHQGGSSRRAKGAQPFASLELEPVEMDSAETGHTELGLLPASEPFGTLNRLLKRAIKAMRETAGVEHFLSPVSRSIYPDYYEVITEPMDLTKLGKRCSACRYRSVEEFRHDLSLVASNCRLYCQDKFPTLPPAADAVVKVGMDTLEHRELAAMLVKTAREGNRLEGLWNKHMSAAINASPELATMPGMQKLARQLGFSTGEEADDLEDDDDSEDSVRQPDTARIARQVFFDKLVGVQSPTRKADHRRRESSQGSPGKLSPPKPTSRHAASNGKPSVSSEKGKPAEASPGTGTSVSGKSRARSASLDSSKKGGIRDGVMVKTEESIDARGPGETRSGTLRVSMRLSNEMPEFVVKKSKYDEMMKTQWRSEMHIQMAFMDDPEEPPRIYEGSLVGVKPRDPKTGFMPWECMMVEWDDEKGVNTVNPWEIEAVTSATASARRRAPAGGHG